MPHVHLPLQSGDDGVLRRMGRRYLSAEYAAIVGRIRAALPGVAMHADAIVGFPTEDDAAWDRSVGFIRSLDLAGLHVFRYSPRPGTAATRMAGQVDEPTKKRRAAELLAVAADARARWARAHVGPRGGRAARDAAGRRPLGRPRRRPHARRGRRPPPTVDLENAIARVAVDAVDPDVRDRVVGRILSLSRPPRTPGAPADVR